MLFRESSYQQAKLSEVFDYLEALFKEQYVQTGFHSVYETWHPLPKLTIKDFQNIEKSIREIPNIFS